MFAPARRKSSIAFSTSCLIATPQSRTSCARTPPARTWTLSAAVSKSLTDCLNPLQHLSDCLLEDQAIERHNRHHRIIRVQPDSMLDGNLGSQSASDRLWSVARPFQNGTRSSCSKRSRCTIFSRCFAMIGSFAALIASWNVSLAAIISSTSRPKVS